MADRELTHWEHFIVNYFPELEESVRCNGPIQTRIHRPSQAKFEEAVFTVQFIHPKWGARNEELILFRDGTWRYIPR